MKNGPLKLINSLLTLLILSLVFVGMAQGQSLIYSNAVASLNPAGYWPMHEGTPPAQGNMETNYGTLGILGNAYYPDYQVNSGAFLHQFPGALANDPDQSVYFTDPLNNGGSTTNSLIVPHTSPLATVKPPFTLECWYMVTNFGTFQGDVLSECDGSKAQGFRIYYQNNGTNSTTTGFTAIFYDHNHVGSGQQINYPGTVSNNWHYLVLTCDAQTNITTYLDGNKSLGPTAFVGRYDPDTHEPFALGNGLGNARGFRGLIDEAAVYPTNLALADVTNHYYDATNLLSAAGQYFNDVTSRNPLIYLRMDSPSYTAPAVAAWPVLANYGLTNGVAVGNGVYTPGTIPGIVSIPSYLNYPRALVSETAAHLSGVSSFADAGFAPIYNPIGTTPFSISLVFRGNPTDTNRVQSIIGHGTNSWELGLNVNGSIVFNSGTNSTAVVATGTGAGDLTSTTTAYDDGNWHQVVVVHNGTTNTLYVDGVANNTNIVGANNIGNALDVMIGSDPCYTNNPVGWGRQFAGQVCEVSFFTNALTVTQVQSLYSAAGVLPTFRTQPISAAVSGGANFTNSVAISGGSAPLSYQWYTNGVAIGGAPNIINGSTNLSLIFQPVLPGNASTNYYFVVTNFVGSVTSSVVSLTVYSNIVFTGQFPLAYTNPVTLYGGMNVSGTNYVGSSPSFSVTALGAVPISYQWYTNNVIIGGATGTGFALTNCQLSSPTNIYCVLANSFGSVTSTVWSVSYLAAPMAPFPQAVLAAQPIAYWRLNEAGGPNNGNPGDAGEIANDYQSANNAVYTNVFLGNGSYSPTTDPAETSAYFGYDAGSGCFAGMIGTNVDFSTPSGTSGEFSVALWANGQGIVQNGNSGLVTKGYFNGEELNLDNGGPGSTVRIEVRDAAAGDHSATNSFKLGNDSNWHFIAGVCDQANSSVLLYLDGQLVGRGTINAGLGIFNSAAIPLQIGARNTSATTPGNNQFQGLLNDVALYNYALGPGQIVSQFGTVGGTVKPYFFSLPSTNASAGINKTLTIPVTAIGTPPISFVWTNVTAGGSAVASGVTNATTLNATLSYANIPASWNSNQLELIVSNAYGTTNAFFNLSLTNTINLNPTNIVFSVTGGNQLTLTWPADHTGWRLLAQTNSLSVGLSTNWSTVPNSTNVNQVTIPMNLTNGSVFYRLTYP